MKLCSEGKDDLDMEAILNKLMEFLHNNEDDMDEEKAEIVKYGLEILLLKVTFFTVTLIMGALMHSLIECLIFTAFFSSIRSLAGGYHANTRLQCFIQSMLTFASVLGILKLEKVFPEIIIPLIILSVIFAAVIFYFAPIDTENKRLDDTECRTFKKKSRIVILVEIVIGAVAYFFNCSGVACSVMLALIVTGVLMMTQLIINRRI